MSTVSTVSSVSAMAALASPVAGQIVYLTQSGREGLFECLSGTAPADTQMGLYVPSSTSGLYWSRQWDGIHGSPTWFGAQPGNSSFDSLPALNGCLSLCPHVQLPVGALYISDTWKIQQDNRTVEGVHKSWIGYTANTSQIIIMGANAATHDVVLVGKAPSSIQNYNDTLPTDLSGFVKQAELRYFDAGRTAAAVCTAAGSEANAPVGFRFMHTWHLQCSFLNSIDSPLGFYWAANVYCFHEKLTYLKTTANASGAGDYAFGYFIDGNYRLGVFAAGGNASLYYKELKAQITASVAGESQGFSINGGYSDTWIEKFETIGCKKGIVVVGLADTEAASGNSQSTSTMATNNDLHILQPVIDQPSDRGIEISKVVRYGVCEIVDPYVAIGSASAAFHFHDGNGVIKVVGGHAYGWPSYNASGSGKGVLGQNQSGIWAQGLTLIGFPQPVSLSNCFSPHVECPIVNPFEREPTGAAIDLTSVNNGFIGCHVTGGPASGPYFAVGVRCNGTGVIKSEVRGTGIDTGVVTTKLTYNGAPVGSVGTFGTTNYYSGVAA